MLFVFVINVLSCLFTNLLWLGGFGLNIKLPSAQLLPRLSLRHYFLMLNVMQETYNLPNFFLQLVWLDGESNSSLGLQSPTLYLLNHLLVNCKLKFI